jgi:cell division protein FtsL
VLRPAAQEGALEAVMVVVVMMMMLMMMVMMMKVHWKLYLEMADLAKRENRIEEARKLYKKVCRLQVSRTTDPPSPSCR